MIVALISFVTSKLGKYAMIVVAALAFLAAAYGALKMHDNQVLAEEHARQVAAQAVEDAATYKRNIEALQEAAEAQETRAAALVSTHQRIANAPASSCNSAPAAIRAAILHPDTSDSALGHP
jgi:hypothetical protein